MGELQILSDNLSRWAVIAWAAAGLHVSPSMDSFDKPFETGPTSEISFPGEISVLGDDPYIVQVSAMTGSSGQFASNAPPQDPGAPCGPSLVEQIAIWKQACAEAKLATEILREFRQEATAHEVMQYANTIGVLLEATPEDCSLDQARGFTLGLQAARSVLADNASSFPLWQRMARLVDPGRSSRRVPGRFLRKVEVPSGEALVMTSAEIRVHRALSEFLTPDADSVTRQG